MTVFDPVEVPAAHGALTSTVLLHQIGEPPHVAEADREGHAAQHELPLVAPGGSLRHRLHLDIAVLVDIERRELHLAVFDPGECRLPLLLRHGEARPFSVAGTLAGGAPSATE